MPTRWQNTRVAGDKLFGFFVGRVMKVMAGKGGNSALVNEAPVATAPVQMWMG